MQKTMILILCWLILIGLGCGNGSEGVQAENPKNECQVIVHLETRNEVVTVMSRHEGLVYTVTTKDGRILAERFSEQELQLRLSNIYHLLKTSYADNGRSGAVWAGS